MLTPEQRLLGLRAHDERFRVAHEGFDAAWSAAQQAAEQEWKTTIERNIAYTKVLKNGFIITEVLDPSKISYEAGFTRMTDEYGGYTRPRKTEIDDTHAQSLIGKFAVFELIAGEHNITHDPENLRYTGINSRMPEHYISEPLQPASGSLLVHFHIEELLSNQDISPLNAGVLYEEDPDFVYSWEDLEFFDRESAPRSVTKYFGELSAMSWRLPTEDEIVHNKSIVVGSAL